MGIARLTVAALITVFTASACISVTPHPQVATASQPIIPTFAPGPSATDTPTQIAPTTTPSQLPGATSRPSPARTPARATPTPPPPTLNANDPACADPAFLLSGFRWNTVYYWRYNAGSTPAGYDPDAVLAVIKKGLSNIVNESNDCGRPDNIHAFAQYQGKTTAKPCTDQPDGENVIGWGQMPTSQSADAIAVTCPFRALPDGKLAYEADILISTGLDWALSPGSCFFQELLEPTITHEVGHVFGLGHVSETDHPDLTMSTASNGPCNNDEATLGLGDMLGLEQLYPGQ